VSDEKRRRLGIAGVALGVAMLFTGVLVAHFTGLAEFDSLGRKQYPGIPRCLWFEPVVSATECWVLPTTGQLIGFIGSQVLLAGILFGWILNRPLTWSRATVAALIATVEALLLFGVVPNQWLNLTQGTFEWTAQKIAFTLPRWLVLNNDVSISFGAIKDIVSGTYSAVLLGAVAVGAYQVQERAKRKDAPKPQVLSPYGRPIVRGE
jgi:hypothetical protein